MKNLMQLNQLVLKADDNLLHKSEIPAMQLNQLVLKDENGFDLLFVGQ